MRLRESLINMLSEFVGLNKTPDFKLNAKSTQFIAEAVAAESRRYSKIELRIVSKNKFRAESDMWFAHNASPDAQMRHRTLSMNTEHHRRPSQEVSLNPSFRRLSEPSVPTPRTATMSLMPKLDRIRKRISQSFERDDKRRDSMLSEEDAEIESMLKYRRQRHQRRGSETFCGSVAVYSNNFGAINTRL
ncbi:unnamed protein product [Anisakis simplex]|uniref:Uncharacterized protein n=1 Tax=Anisakis simplex TaxID=6269 RepID=A0A158PP71_ANISI|nr:unnamed protein product [Anisakis simplex]